MRKNLTQEVAGAVFGVSQSTVSRRWDLLRVAVPRQAFILLISRSTVFRSL
ncbi:transposase family protein [Streptomyces sp. NPDC058304]